MIFKFWWKIESTGSESMQEFPRSFINRVCHQFILLPEVTYNLALAQLTVPVFPWNPRHSPMNTCAEIWMYTQPEHFSPKESEETRWSTLDRNSHLLEKIKDENCWDDCEDKSLRNKKLKKWTIIWKQGLNLLFKAHCTLPTLVVHCTCCTFCWFSSLESDIHSVPSLRVNTAVNGLKRYLNW